MFIREQKNSSNETLKSTPKVYKVYGKEQWIQKQIDFWKHDDNRDDVRRFILDLSHWCNFKRLSDAFANNQ